MACLRMFSLGALATLLTGCAMVNTINLPATTAATVAVSPIPCVYRFKSLTRPADQAHIEAAIHSVAVGTVVKGGTLSYPEYRFHVTRMADLDTLAPKLLYSNPETLMSSSLKQTLNLRSAAIEMTFDSTDVSATATTIVTFNVRPGSRLYYKQPGGVESDITAKVDKKGKVVLPVSIHEGQKYLYVRAMKDNVTRYIRINIFTNQVQDINRRDY